MGLQEELQSYFKEWCIEFDSTILEKCTQLLQTYPITPEELVDRWLAFTASQLNGAAPSVEGLQKFERTNLQKMSKKAVQAPSKLTAPQNITAVEVITQPANAPSTPIIPNRINVQQNITLRTTILTYGEASEAAFKNLNAPTELNIKLCNYAEDKDYHYVLEVILARMQNLNAITHTIGGKIMKHFGLSFPEKSLSQHPGDVLVQGRVYTNPEKDQVKGSIILESTYENGGNTTKLSTSTGANITFFPGQVVVVQGTSKKESLVAEKIYSGAPTIDLSDKIDIDKPLQIVAAAGPYTSPNNLDFDQLTKLIAYVIEHKPNVVILNGPFLPQTHKPLQKLSTCNYHDFFHTLIQDLMEKIGEHTKLVLVPSHEDIHGHRVYPTLPYNLKSQDGGFILAPDPCLIDINGLILGCTSVDVLSHLDRHECSINANKAQVKKRTNRIAQLSEYLLNQRCFYPLHPPDKDVAVEYGLFKNLCIMETLPHVLLLPSSLQRFIGKVHESVVVNPGMAIEGNGCGNFARIEIRPGSGPVHARISCEVAKF